MKTYAVKHKNEYIRANSRSGGIFTGISDQFLTDGVVYGCILDDKFNAYHIRTEKKEDRDNMRGSKYIQSQMRDCFKQVKKDLEDGKRVLFSGTACQVAGLRCYLQKDYLNLFCIDIVCHGVASKKVWHSYLDWISKGKDITGVNFRNKIDFGWLAHIETIEMGEEKVNSEVFKNLFYGHHILRPSCYECPYKSIQRHGDITIGDYWGIENAVLGFNDNKGVSLVLVNTEKGESAFEKAKCDIIWVETRIEDSMQPPLKEPFAKPELRDRFWKDYKTKDFTYIVSKYGKQPSIWKKILNKIRTFIIRLVK